MSHVAELSEQVPLDITGDIVSYDNPGRPGRLRQALGRGALCLLAGVSFGAAKGFVSTAGDEIPTDISGVPATVQLEPGSHTIDFNGGAIGLRHKSNFEVSGYKLPLGVKSSIDSKDTTLLQSNNSLYNVVLQLFSDPEYIMRHTSNDIANYTKNKTANGAIEGGALMLGGLVFYCGWEERKRRMTRTDRNSLDHAWEIVGPWAMGVASIGLAGSLIYTGANLYETFTRNGERAITPSPLFRDIKKLHGWEMNGLLSGSVNSGAAVGQEFMADTTSYYNELEDNVDTALNEYLRAHELPTGKNMVPILVISDRHCNVAMDRVIELIAKKFGALLVVDPGDDGLNSDLPLGGVCTASLAERLKDLGVKFVKVDGNHDAPEVTKIEENQGIVVLSGASYKVKTSRGTVTLLGDRDPRLSNAGNEIVPSSLEDQSTAVTNVGTGLGQQACKSDSPNILLSHDSRTAKAAILNGCGKIAIGIGGHTHRFLPPEELPSGFSRSYVYTEGTTGGVSPNNGQLDIKLGPMEEGSEASLSVLWYDAEAGEVPGMIHIVMDYEKKVSISEYIPIARSLFEVHSDFIRAVGSNLADTSQKNNP